MSMSLEKSQRYLRVTHFLFNILLIGLGLFYGLIGFLSLLGVSAVYRADLFPKTLIAGMISLSLMLVLAAFFGCAGGYRQAFLYLVIYASMVAVAAIVQFSMGGVSVSYLSSVSGTMDTLWASSTPDQRSVWMRDFQCCYYGPEETWYECKDTDSNVPQDTDCQVVLVDYFTGLLNYLIRLFFSFGSISLLAAGVTLSYGLFGGGPKGNFKMWKSAQIQIHSKEDFEKFVLGDIAPVTVPVVVSVTPVADGDKLAFDRSECC